MADDVVRARICGLATWRDECAGAVCADCTAGEAAVAVGGVEAAAVCGEGCDQQTLRQQ